MLTKPDLQESGEAQDAARGRQDGGLVPGRRGVAERQGTAAIFSLLTNPRPAPRIIAGRHVGLPVHAGEVVSTPWLHCAISRSLPRSSCVDAQPVAALYLESTNMLKSFTAHEVEAMRRDAKKRARADGVILAKALDQVAAEHGYRNWSLLQKNGSIPPDEPQPWLFRRTPEEVAHSMRVIPEPKSRYDRRARSEIARDGVQALDDKFVSPANAVDFAINCMGGLLAQSRFRLNPKSPAY